MCGGRGHPAGRTGDKARVFRKAAIDTDTLTKTTSYRIPGARWAADHEGSVTAREAACVFIVRRSAWTSLLGPRNSPSWSSSPMPHSWRAPHPPPREEQGGSRSHGDIVSWCAASPTGRHPRALASVTPHALCEAGAVHTGEASPRGVTRSWNGRRNSTASGRATRLPAAASWARPRSLSWWTWFPSGPTASLPPPGAHRQGSVCEPSCSWGLPRFALFPEGSALSPGNKSVLVF